MVRQWIDRASSDREELGRRQLVQVINVYGKCHSLAHTLNFNVYLRRKKTTLFSCCCCCCMLANQQLRSRTFWPTDWSSMSSSSKNCVISWPFKLISTSLGLSVCRRLPTTSIPVSRGNSRRTSSSVSSDSPNRLTALNG